jgi:uncharacterized metal-binding protein YceD (DUF177 family)
MRIRVANAIKQTGDEFPFTCSEQWEPVSYGERVLTFSEPVKVEGTYVFDGKAFTVSAKAEATLLSECARCLKAFTERISVSFSERFVKDQPDSEDDETYPYTGDELDLGKAVLDNLLLELPSRASAGRTARAFAPFAVRTGM